MIEPQRRLLADDGRNRAFAEAIRRLVRPGCRVIDLGTGTGFLALLALRAGAAEVWACEAEPGLCQLARAMAHANRGAAIRFACGHSSDLRPPFAADLVIAEVLGNLATEEHLAETLSDARRMLAANGTMIPGRIVQTVCPVVSDRLQRGIDTWSQIGFALDFAPARRVGLNNLYVREVEPGDLLPGADRDWEDLRFPGEHAGRRRGSAHWELAAAATVWGFALWWRAELAPEVILTTDPRAPPTHWQQVYLPLERPLAAQANDGLHLDLATDTRFTAGCGVRWTAELCRHGRRLGRQAMDNRIGCLG